MVYYSAYIVTDPGQGTPHAKQILTEQEYSVLRETYGDRFEALTGAEVIRSLLKGLDLDREAKYLRAKFKNATKQVRQKLLDVWKQEKLFNNQTINQSGW